MSDTIQRLKEQYGPNSPAVAEQLNSIGVELQCRGDTRTALKLHQEALTILEWNKCNALLYDFVKKSKEYAIDMALTLRKIGNIFSEMNNFVGAAGTLPSEAEDMLSTMILGVVHITVSSRSCLCCVNAHHFCRSLQGKPRFFLGRIGRGRWRPEKEDARMRVQEELRQLPSLT